MTVSAGEKGFTKYGDEYVAIENQNGRKVTIEFQDDAKYRYSVYEQNFRSGNVHNPYNRRVFGVGYVGEGPFLSKKPGNRKYPEYQTWSNMIMRCYRDTYQATHTSYIGCSVDPEWHNYQNFAMWWNENFYKIPEERMDFDKDILFKGNKVYAPENCCIIPHRINLLFVTRKSQRNGTPVGVSKSKSGTFHATCGIDSGVVENLGTFSTSEGAFTAYKERKERNIKEVANRYRQYLPDKVYCALQNWVVEITD
jgi:hypothetical protein